MTDATARRRQFVQSLKDNPFVADLDYTRDGYRTVVLELSDNPPETEGLEECGGCGAVGLPERVQGDGHDCREFSDSTTNIEE